MGSAQNDTIFGNGGTDSILAGDGADRIEFATAAHLGSAVTVAGGNGNDTISFTTENRAVQNADFTNVLSVEALTFADGIGSSVVLAGTANTAGIALVYGGSGNDTLTVDETIYTAPTFHGAEGTDVLILSNSDAALIDTFFTDVLSVASFQTANGANDITLGAQATEAGIATVTGGSGSDTLNATGMTSSVTLMGGLGADSLTGGSVSSWLQGWTTGSAANNSTNAAGYNDTLTGGTGIDVFVLGDSSGNAYGGSSNPALNTMAQIKEFDISEDIFQLNAFSGASASTFSINTEANEAYFAKGGVGPVLKAYVISYNDTTQTGSILYDQTNVVAQFKYTGSGDNLTADNFNIV